VIIIIIGILFIILGIGIQYKFNKLDKAYIDLYVLLQEFEGLKLKVAANSKVLKRWCDFLEKYYEEKDNKTMGNNSI